MISSATNMIAFYEAIRHEKPQIPPLDKHNSIEEQAAKAKTWINAPANTPLLHTIQTLNLASPTIPQEITALKNLKKINIVQHDPEGAAAITLYKKIRTALALPAPKYLTSSPEEALLAKGWLNAPINQTLFEGVRDLNLSETGLSKVPQEIEKLRNLEKLNLSGNKICSIPKEMKWPLKLSILHLDINYLSPLSEELNLPSNLKSLILHGDVKKIALRNDLNAINFSLFPGELQGLARPGLKISYDIDWSPFDSRYRDFWEMWFTSIDALFLNPQYQNRDLLHTALDVFFVTLGLPSYYIYLMFSDDKRLNT